MIKEKTVSIRDEKLNEDFYMPIRIGKKENFKEWLIENSKDISKGRYSFNELTRRYTGENNDNS